MEVLLLNAYNSLDGNTLSSTEEREVKMVETKGRRTVVKSKRSLERRLCLNLCRYITSGGAVLMITIDRLVQDCHLFSPQVEVTDCSTPTLEAKQLIPGSGFFSGRIPFFLLGKNKKRHQLALSYMIIY